MYIPISNIGVYRYKIYLTTILTLIDFQRPNKCQSSSVGRFIYCQEAKTKRN